MHTNKHADENDLRHRVEALADRYENTSRDTRITPDAIAHRLRLILKEAADA